MAIAFGAISSVSTSQTPTSVAVSGSDTVGFVYVVGESASDQITAVTWNSVSMTKIAAAQTPTDRYSSVWWVANPASSTTISFTGGTYWRSFSFYYTGASQTGQPDSSNTGTSSSSTALTIATTVVSSDSWYVMCQKDSTGGLTYTGSGVLSSMRANADAGGIAISDSNGTVGLGSQSGTLTSTSTNHGGIAFSIKPATVRAVTFGGAASSNFGAGSSTQSLALTIAGSNPGLLVAFSYNNVASTNSCTWNGTSMTSVTKLANVNARSLELFYLDAPAVGSYNVVLTFSGASVEGTLNAVYYNGVAQSGFVEANGTTSQATNVASVNVSVTSATDNAWIFAAVTNRETSTWTPTSGINRYHNPTGSGGVGTVGTELPTTTAGSQTITWNMSPNDSGPIIAVSMKPASTSANTGFFNLM